MNIMQEWPLKSKFDPKIYGMQDSAITTELVEREMRGLMTVKEVAYITDTHYDHLYIDFFLT